MQAFHNEEEYKGISFNLQNDLLTIVSVDTFRLGSPFGSIIKDYSEGKWLHDMTITEITFEGTRLKLLHIYAIEISNGDVKYTTIRLCDKAEHIEKISIKERRKCENSSQETKSSLHFIDDVEQAYKFLLQFLPQNLANTKRQYSNQAVARSVYDETLDELAKKYGPLRIVHNKVKSEVDKLSHSRCHQYNPTKFKELCSRFYYYNDAGNWINHKKNTCHTTIMNEGDEEKKKAISDYFDIHSYAKFIISDLINDMRTPDKRKEINPVQLAAAKEYFKLNYSGRKQISAKQSGDERGDKGEEQVELKLRSLDYRHYRRIEKRSVNFNSRNGKHCIMLANDEGLLQEYDHLIISSKGVFQIETKNYWGNIIIDKYGNWKRILEDGKTAELLKSPDEQIKWNEKLLKSILPEQVPVHSIVCLADPQTKLTIEDPNYRLHIVKIDKLNKYIEHYQEFEEGELLTTDDMDKAERAIYRNMLVPNN